MVGARHKGVVLNRVCKYNQLCTAQRALITGAVCNFLDNFTHFRYRVHIDAGLGGGYIDRRADIFGN